MTTPGGRRVNGWHCARSGLGLVESDMPRGDKSSYTQKQKRQARHIEEGYEERGASEKEAARRAWAWPALRSSAKCVKGATCSGA